MRYRRHSCTYPIEVGNIIKVLDPWDRFNSKLGFRAQHTLYIWIIRHGRWEEGRPGKNRIIHAAFLYIPNMPEGEILKPAKDFYMIFKRKMLKVKLTQHYLKGREHKVIAQNIKFNYSNESWARFYRKVGLLD